MSHLAVFRVAKLKGLGALAAVSQHQVRTRPTPNAAPAGQVRLLVGASDPAAAARVLIDSLPSPPRAGSVLAIEAVLSASPGFFRDDPEAAGTFNDERTMAWAQASVGWLKKHFGEANVTSAVLHLDESTPHLHAVIVPMDFTPRKKGKTPRLNAKRWLGGRERLSAMQDDYADTLAPLGISRGVKGSRAKHVDIRRYYSEAAKREATLIAAENQSRVKDDALQIGMRLFMQKRLVPAADGVLIYRMPDDRRRYEPRIAPYRFAVWATLRRIQSIIEHEVMREVAAFIAPEPAQYRPPRQMIR